MLSPWRSPLPLKKYMTSRVTVYFYNGRWIPIIFYTLGEAIALHRFALKFGKELFIFPPDCNPNEEPASSIVSFSKLKINSSVR